MKEICELPVDAMAVDVKVELIQALIPMGLRLENSLESGISGVEYRDMTGGVSRGAVYLLDHKLPIMFPRVRDQGKGKEVRLRNYERLQEPRDRDEGVLRRILHGLSCRSYEECAADVPETFGMSGSSVSRRYIRASAKEFSFRAKPGEKSTDK